MPDPSAREIVARALDVFHSPVHSDYRNSDAANFILAALSDAGFGIYPREPRWPEHEWANVSGALCDTSDLPGDLLPSRAIRLLTGVRNTYAAALERIAVSDAGSASDRRDIARRALTRAGVVRDEHVAASRAALSEESNE